MARLTKLEKHAIVFAANLILAGDDEGWPDDGKLWAALDTGSRKVALTLSEEKHTALLKERHRKETHDA